MTEFDKKIKRVFDLIFSIIVLLTIGWFILLLALIVCIEIGEFPFFFQERLGQFGKPFIIFKLKSMKSKTTTLVNNMDRLTKFGKFLRKYKLDELPQFLNVVIGNMSVVGPRPDFMSFLNELKEEDKIILTIKPGITGPASIIFMNEEQILANQADPHKYNKEVIWPKKVEINKTYILEYSFWKDLGYIVKTLV